MQQINAIREKAAEAEAIVKAITSDIQRLDVAKRNLTRTMQTIERWGMLSECRHSASCTRQMRPACSTLLESIH